jgi:hypothetical protein
LIIYHLTLGLWIRNELGLWRGNKVLMKNLGTPTPDKASIIIIEAVWDELHIRKKIKNSQPDTAKSDK